MDAVRTVLENIILGAFRSAIRRYRNLKNGSEIVAQGVAFGDLVHDTEIKADKEIGSAFIEYFKDLGPVAYVTVEGMDTVDTDNGFLWVTVDPLDGSLNYRASGATQLPHAACVTILRRKEDATFSDIIAAGVMDFRSGTVWVSYRSHQGGFKAWSGNVFGAQLRPIKTQCASELRLGEQLLLVDMHYPDNRVALAVALRQQKGSLRSYGSAAYEMALVASGEAVGFVSFQQKQHELGAGYALALGAGGAVVDWEGRDIGSLEYNFTTQNAVVLACNTAMAADLVRRLPRP